jgi:hypothetical protein
VTTRSVAPRRRDRLGSRQRRRQEPAPMAMTMAVTGWWMSPLLPSQRPSYRLSSFLPHASASPPAPLQACASCACEPFPPHPQSPHPSRLTPNPRCRPQSPSPSLPHPDSRPQSCIGRQTNRRQRGARRQDTPQVLGLRRHQLLGRGGPDESKDVLKAVLRYSTMKFWT